MSILSLAQFLGLTTECNFKREEIETLSKIFMLSNSHKKRGRSSVSDISVLLSFYFDVPMLFASSTRRLQMCLE